MSDKLQQKALRLHTHTVVYEDNSLDFSVLQYGMTGAYTAKAIAKSLNTTPGKVQFRLHKAGISLREIRSDPNPLKRRMLQLMNPVTAKVIRKTIQPRFVSFAQRQGNASHKEWALQLHSFSLCHWQFCETNPFREPNRRSPIFIV